MTVLVPFNAKPRTDSLSFNTRFKTFHIFRHCLCHARTSNILLENLSPVNHCDCAAPIRSPRSWANGFFKNRGSSCKRSLSLLPQLSRGQIVENRLRTLLSNRNACYVDWNQSRYHFEICRDNSSMTLSVCDG